MKTSHGLSISRRCCVSASLILCIGGFVQNSGAVVYTLADGDSSVKVNDATGSGSAYDWTVGGVNHLDHQWLYFRIGSGPESSIDSIGSPTSVLDPSGKILTTTYANSTLSVKVVFSLSDSLNPGESAFNQDITINNLSGGTLDLHFFQFSDYDLNSSLTDQSVQFLASAGKYRYAVQSDGPWQLTENVWPNPSFGTTVRVESAVDGHILASLLDGTATTLNNTAASGAGNYTYAFQWDRSMAAGSTLQISKLQIISVPEPSSIAVLGMGVVAVFAVRNRRFREAR